MYVILFWICMFLKSSESTKENILHQQRNKKPISKTSLMSDLLTLLEGLIQEWRNTAGITSKDWEDKKI